jgi:hypothetical protein
MDLARKTWLGDPIPSTGYTISPDQHWPFAICPLDCPGFLPDDNFEKRMLGIVKDSVKTESVVSTQIESFPSRSSDESTEETTHKTKPAPPSKKLKRPCQEAFIAYRLDLLHGKTQTELARDMTKELGYPVEQYQVSRWLKQVQKWVEAGNILPNLYDKSPPKKAPVDTEVGPRVDKSTPKGSEIRKSKGQSS